MGGVIYQAFYLLFGNGMVEDCQNFITSMIGNGTTYGALGNTLLSLVNSDLFFWFQTISLSLLTVIFFFVDLMGQAQRDQITMERLINSFVKLMLVAVLIINLPQILVYFFQFCEHIAIIVKDAKLGTVTNGKVTATWWGESEFPKWTDKIAAYDNKTMEEIFTDKDTGYGSSIKGIIGSFKTFFAMLLPMIICQVARIAALFIVATTTINVVLRALFMPFAVAQCFEDGSRSTGIRNLKDFLAECMNFAGINAALKLTSMISNGMIADEVAKVFGAKDKIINIDSIEMLNTLADSTSIFTFVVLQFAAIGAMIGINRIINRVFS